MFDFFHCIDTDVIVTFFITGSGSMPHVLFESIDNIY